MLGEGDCARCFPFLSLPWRASDMTRSMARRSSVSVSGEDMA